MLKPCTRISALRFSTSSLLYNIAARKMSTSAAVSPAAAAAVKKEFLVILPDQTGALERRMNVRPYVWAFSVFFFECCEVVGML